MNKSQSKSQIRRSRNRTKTAEKEFRKSLRRKKINSIKKRSLSKIKFKIFDLLKNFEKENQDEKKTELKLVINNNFKKFNSILSKIKKTNVFHRNKSSRLLSNMNSKIKKIVINK